MCQKTLEWYVDSLIQKKRIIFVFVNILEVNQGEWHEFNTFFYKKVLPTESKITLRKKKSTKFTKHSVKNFYYEIEQGISSNKSSPLSEAAIMNCTSTVKIEIDSYLY